MARAAAKRDKRVVGKPETNDGVEELMSCITRKDGKIMDLVCTRRLADGTIERVRRVEPRVKKKPGEPYSRMDYYAFIVSLHEYQVEWLQGTV